MESVSAEGPVIAVRRPFFSQIRWTAIFAGSVVGVALYLLLSLLGVAVGLNGREAQAGLVGGVPIVTGVWSVVGMLVAAYFGGYVGARMSGLARRADGLLHGLVAWGTITVLFAWLTTTTLGPLLGGTLDLLGQGLQGLRQDAATASTQQREIADRIGSPATSPVIAALQRRLLAGDRKGAIDVMVNQMRFSTTRAGRATDDLLALFGRQGQAAATAPGSPSLVGVSWWLFLTLLLSLLAGLWGGVVGANSVSHRATEDHTDERYLRTYP